MNGLSSCMYTNGIKILPPRTTNISTFASNRASFTASTVSSGLMSPTEISFKTFLRYTTRIHNKRRKQQFKHLSVQLSTFRLLVPLVVCYDVGDQKCRAKMTAAKFLAYHISFI